MGTTLRTIRSRAIFRTVLPLPLPESVGTDIERFEPSTTFAKLEISNNSGALSTLNTRPYAMVYRKDTTDTSPLAVGLDRKRKRTSRLALMLASPEWIQPYSRHRGPQTVFPGRYFSALPDEQRELSESCLTSSWDRVIQ